MKLLILVFLFVFASSYAEEDEKTIEQSYTQEVLNFLDKCGSKSYTLCFKERALHYFDSLPNKMEIADVIVVKPNENAIDRTARKHEALPEEPRAREEALDEIITNKIINFFTSHNFEFKMPESAANEFQRSMEEGRKKSKKNLMPLLILLKLKMATIGALALKTLAVVSFKALILAKIALTISLILALKKLTESHQHSSYEVIAHDDHHRSFKQQQQQQELPYRGHSDKYEEPPSS